MRAPSCSPAFTALNEFEHGPEEPGDHETEEGPDDGAQENHNQERTEADGDLDPKNVLPGLTEVGTDSLSNGFCPAASVEREEKIKGPRNGQGEYRPHRATDGDLRSVQKSLAPVLHFN